MAKKNNKRTVLDFAEEDQETVYVRGDGNLANGEHARDTRRKSVNANGLRLNRAATDLGTSGEGFGAEGGKSSIDAVQQPRLRHKVRKPLVVDDACATCVPVPASVWFVFAHVMSRTPAPHLCNSLPLPSWVITKSGWAVMVRWTVLICLCSCVYAGCGADSEQEEPLRGKGCGLALTCDKAPSTTREKHLRLVPSWKVTEG